MHINRMLIHVRQGVQQLGAFLNRGYEEEELVFQLNSMQHSFVKKYVRSLPNGIWEVTDSRKLGALTVTDHRPIGQYTDAFTAILPGDLLYLLGATALLDCTATGSTVTQPISYVRVPPTAKVPTIPPDPAELFYALNVNGAHGSVSLDAKYPSPDPGFLDEVVEVAAQLLRSTGQDNWPDRLGNRRNEAGTTGSRLLYLKGNAGNGTMDDAALQTGSFNLTTIVPVSPVTLPVTLFDGSSIHNALATPFHRPGPGHAVGVRQGRELKLFGPSTGKITGVLLNYIRKPDIINYRLNQSCELPDPEAEEVCDMLIERITATVNKEDYQAIATDNSRRGAV